MKSSKISYIRMFMLLGGIMTVVFGLLTAFIPGLCLAWAVYDSWNPGLGWQIEYMNMQPQIYVLTPWRLISSIGGIFGIISMLKEDVRFLRLGFLGIFLGIIGFLFLAPFRDGSFEVNFYPLILPAYGLTFLGVDYNVFKPYTQVWRVVSSHTFQCAIYRSSFIAISDYSSLWRSTNLYQHH